MRVYRIASNSEPTSKDAYMQVAHEFLQSLMKEFAVLSMKSFRPRIGADNFPFMYSERRLDSVVCKYAFENVPGIALKTIPF